MSVEDETPSLRTLTALLSLVDAARARTSGEREKLLSKVSSMLQEAVELTEQGYRRGSFEYERARGLLAKALSMLDHSGSHP